jgi:drug/metabolite transporter (DMT)-like permease
MSSAVESAIVMGVLTAISGVAALRDRNPLRATAGERGWIVWLGVADSLNVLLFFEAYKITIGVSVLSHYLAPVFVAIASPILLRERLTRRTTLAVAASFAGLAVMLGPTRSGASAAAILKSASLGAGSAFFYASNVIGTKFVARSYSTSETLFWHGLVATPLLAACVPVSAWASIDSHAASYLAVLSIGPGALAGLVFVWGLRRMPAAHASTLTLLEPLIAVLAGALVFGEELGPRSVVGGALILGGALAVMTAGARTASVVAT